jgi:hypothetical protein
MSKIILIFLVIIVLGGCSATRKTGKTLSVTSEGLVLSGEVLRQNITGKSFFIQKAEVEFDSEELNGKFNAIIKYKDDKYLISIKSKTGIEIARAFLSRDSILINDRINKKFIYGKPDWAAKRFGFSYEILPVLFGDYVTSNQSVTDTIKCVRYMTGVEARVKGVKLNYEIDCKNAKVRIAENEGSLNVVTAQIEYSDYIKTDGILVPSEIKIRNFKPEWSVQIKLGKIERPWDGAIEFIPGNKYELFELK